MHVTITKFIISIKLREMQNIKRVKDKENSEGKNHKKILQYTY